MQKKLLINIKNLVNEINQLTLDIQSAKKVKEDLMFSLRDTVNQLFKISNISIELSIKDNIIYIQLNKLF